MSEESSRARPTRRHLREGGSVLRQVQQDGGLGGLRRDGRTRGEERRVSDTCRRIKQIQLVLNGPTH